MLAATRLRDNLRAFADIEYTSFTAFPASRAAARRAWAGAFDDYFAQVEELVPGVGAGHPALVTSAVNSAFDADPPPDRGLGLDPTTSVTAAATDFADAWKAAVDAITFAAVTDSAGNVWTPSVFTNAAPLRTALDTRLLALFRDFPDPRATAVDRLGDIADAFHTASSGLIATVVVVSSSGVTLPTVTMNVR